MKKFWQIYLLLFILFVMYDWNFNEYVKDTLKDITYEMRDVEEELDDIHEEIENIPHTRADEIGYYTYDSAEQIAEEIRLGEMELLAQLIEAEAGNQDLYGKRLVADVVINRSALWNMSIEETIFQQLDGVYMFSSVGDGNFDKAAWHISAESFEASRMEYEALNCTDRADAGTYVMYFRTGRYSDYGTPAFKHGDHYFSYGCNKIGE